VRADIKFCGMTRPEDARAGAALGAAYVGVIFAGGPRKLTVPRAEEVLAAATESEDGPRTVGVFGDATPEEIAATAERLRLSVVQLHADPGTQTVERLRTRFAGEIWPVVRLDREQLPDDVGDLFASADAVVLDAKVSGRLGGTGVALPWASLAARLESVRDDRRPAKLILAGGLRPENVSMAISLLRPDVVDVSSGVETAPGIKDHARMRAFRDAVFGE